MRIDFRKDLFALVTEAQLAALVLSVVHDMERDGETIDPDFKEGFEWCKALQRRISRTTWTDAQKWLHPDR